GEVGIGAFPGDGVDAGLVLWLLLRRDRPLKTPVQGSPVRRFRRLSHGETGTASDLRSLSN
ncbi:MAG: hypothetical protein ACRC8Y_22615, partial [Chroococcales cyanobacterium]